MATIQGFLLKEASLECTALELEIRHPYEDSELFELPLRRCPLDDGSVSVKPCIPLDVVLDACAVFTGDYTRRSTLCRDRDGTQPVESPLLEAGVYYLVMDNDPQKNYPVFKSFHHWVPPPREKLPRRWFTSLAPAEKTAKWSFPPSYVSRKNHSTLSEQIKALDGQCALSRAVMPLEPSHIVPVKWANWYEARGIARQLHYTRAVPTDLPHRAGIHDLRNFLTHTYDIHMLWDLHYMLYVPVKGAFMAYVISPVNWVIDLHCANLVLPDRTDGYLLFIRFALAIFGQYSGSAELLTHPDASLSAADFETSSESVSEGDDVARIVIEACEAGGIELPEDLAAVWSDNLGYRSREHAILRSRWFETHPQIRMVSDPSQMDTSSADPEVED
ncbi:hypothetical protein OE88DRAFT_1812427 [Heliocybe sulcata]|uniref:Uncharacterized protein n=1 Tax=Heliocybe sulcata TaxID=5364 RepID=A0A5C3MK62_9AGAM|nr:hypothetical protein OE88DRAFT_1812427 [Heliocybe sulcata]